MLDTFAYLILVNDIKVKLLILMHLQFVQFFLSFQLNRKLIEDVNVQIRTSQKWTERYRLVVDYTQMLR